MIILEKRGTNEKNSGLSLLFSKFENFQKTKIGKSVCVLIMNLIFLLKSRKVRNKN